MRSLLRLTPAIFILLIIMCAGCADHSFSPKFKIPKETIIADIEKLIKTETTRIEGFKIPKGDTYSLLIVQLINPTNLPANLDSVQSLRKKIALIVKKALKDPNQFEVFDIAISYEKVTKGILGTQTIESKGLVHKPFKVEEL